MNWQKRARLVVAVVGIASAIGVYAVMGERVRPTAAVPPTRLDPKAIIESQGNVLQQVRGTRQDYVIEAAQQLTYEGGATKLVGVKVTVKNRGGRDFAITAREAQAGEREEDLRLNGDVKLAASDGFEITTDEAFFSQADGVVRAPEAFAFKRGRMSGTGLGMTYDKNNDVLTIADKAVVTIAGEDEGAMSSFEAGSATLTRPMHLLALAGTVHVVHDTQVIDARQAIAHLTDDDSRMTAIELSGEARVAGSGQGLDSMAADRIDITYADDGQTIDRLKMAGKSSVAMTGTGTGRQIAGESLDMTLAPDGSITTLAGRDGVRLDMPVTADAPARRVTAKSLDATGESGKGLTASRFRDEVEFREEAGGQKAARIARSRALDVAMADDAVTSATFTGDVRFEQEGLQARAGHAVYDPPRDSLRLSRGDEGTPRVADEQVTVEGAAIAVGLTSRRMTATGGVRTTLRQRAAPPRDAARGAAPGGDSKLPGLLKQEQPANVNADSFTYEGSGGKAVYTGSAALIQGDTAIRGDEITINQATGDLVASGDARSTIALDSGRSTGRAARITYTDAERLITYDAATPPARGSGAAVPARPAPAAQLSGPQGDLRGDKLQIVLAEAGGKADRLEAFNNVALALDSRKASGTRLTYFATDERYVMTGTSGMPVKVIENCREIVGRTLIFFKSTDRIVVDGNEESRTQTTNGATCAQSPPRPR